MIAPPAAWKQRRREEARNSMRFAITASDRYLGVLEALLERGWILIKLFTGPVDNRIHHNRAVIERAQKLKVDVQISRLCDANLAELAARGCEALVVASYQWRIGDWRPHLKYAVNFHPSPLPVGRGPFPLPAAILAQASRWGVACHKLEREFDAGDVLAVAEFPLGPQDDYDSLDLRTQLAARRLAAEVAGNFAACWERATPQSGGSYYPPWSAAQRRLDFSCSVEEVLRRVRAFGPLESLVQLDGATLFVRRAVGWTEPHQWPPGKLVHVNNLAMVVAVADGFVGLTEWSLIDPNAVTGTLRR